MVMRFARSLLLWAACLAAPFAMAAKQTVCTVTINSADEKETFRRFLPADKYDFVELVERNRRDWLASACQAKVSCDVLLISGHHGEGNVFFSDSLEKDEYLPISELERVGCSDSCAGHSPAEAARLTELLRAQRGESSRDRMRLVFQDVPVIYGFSSAAPLGPQAASTLNRYFQSVGAGEVARGRASSGLLRQFAPQGLVAAPGMRAGDALGGLRKDVCTFANDRLTDAQRLDAVHQILQRPVAEGRLLLDRIERFTGDLDDGARAQPDVAQALARIAADTATRDRYLAFARDADQPITRARMIDVAEEIGWLSPAQRREEIAQMFGEILARGNVAGPDVDLACTANKNGALDGLLRTADPGAGGDVGRAALLACMGDRAARTRALQGLVSTSEADVRIAQFYLRHRPVTQAEELRELTQAIAGMKATDAQARALDVLARHYLSDRESLETLSHLFARTGAWQVQNAIAGVLLRADPAAIARREVLRTLREYRVKSLPEGNMVDALIERLQLS